MKTRIYRIIKLLMLLVILMIGYIACSNVLIGKSGKGRIDAFYKEEEDSLDAVFIGSSHLYYAMFPLQIYEEYGIRSSVIGGDGLGVPMTYYCVKEAISTQHPKVIVVDLYKAFSDLKIESIPFTHNLIDAWPYSKNKIDAVQDLIPEENRLEFYMPLYLYHTRWKELKQEDFEESICYTKGAAPQFGRYDASSFMEVDRNQKQEIPETALEYIHKIINVCDENNVKLIFTVLPYVAIGENEYQQKVFNSLYDVADEYNVEIINFFHNMDELDLDLTFDFSDSGHLNYYGGVKATRYIGRILADQYVLEIAERDEDWDKELEIWKSYICSRQLSKIVNREDYINFVKEKGYDYIILLKGDSLYAQELKESGLVELDQSDSEVYLYINMDGKLETYNAQPQNTYPAFHENAIQIINEDKLSLKVGKSSYPMNGDAQIVIYDNKLGRIIDHVTIDLNQQNIVR